jgi:hypothetical protein
MMMIELHDGDDDDVGSWYCKKDDESIKGESREVRLPDDRWLTLLSSLLLGQCCQSFNNFVTPTTE